MVGMARSKTEILIRKATKEDVPSLVSMELELVSHVRQFDSNIMAHGIAKMYSKYFTAQFKRRKIFAFIAESRGEPIGFIIARFSISPGPFINKKHIYIDDIYVDRSLRKKGIGSMLVQNVLAIAKKKKIKRILLSVHSKSGALKAYEKMGFVETRKSMELNI